MWSHADAPPRATTFAVLGAAGTTADMAGAVLRSAGFRDRRLGAEERRGAGDAPVVVLVDPDDDDWERALRAGRVVVLAQTPLSPEQVGRFVLAGADAVLDTTCGAQELVDAVDGVAAGRVVLSPSQTRVVAELARHLQRGTVQPEVRLSNREREVLDAIIAGLSVKQTARRLAITDKAVENLQTRLYRKLGARNRAQAVAHAYALGLAPVDA